MATPAKRKKITQAKNPLWLHSGTGQWCKKIRGKHIYFGEDLQAALAQYEVEKASWQAGVNPREEAGDYDDPTVADVCNAYLDAPGGQALGWGVVSSDVSGAGSHLQADGNPVWTNPARDDPETVRLCDVSRDAGCEVCAGCPRQ